MHRGYIKIWRKIQDNFLYREPRKFSKFEAWVDIIMEVQYSPDPQEVLLGNIVLICNRGESLKSLETWAKRWNWDKSAARRFFILLKKHGNLETIDERKTTRIKVTNYDTYCPLRNADETQLKRKRNASDSQMTPDNKDNKVNKEKKVKKTTYSGDVQTVLDYLNDKKGSAYKDGSNILARLNSGGSVEDCIKIIENKFRDPYFIDNPQHLNPVTLFRKSHWDKYLNDNGNKPVRIYSETTQNNLDVLREASDERRKNVQ